MPSSAHEDDLAIIDAIHSWCAAIDGRDWAALEALITDPIFIDYSSNGTTGGLLAASEWTDRLRVLHGFDKTLHMVSNVRPHVDGDAAICTSYVNAMHFLMEGEEEFHAHACGQYRHDLIRIEGRWRIKGATFLLAGRQGGHKEFDRAFGKARELAPQRM